MKQPVDFVIITALEEELVAVLSKLPDYKKLSPSEDSVRCFYEADLPATFPDGSQCIYRVIVLSLLGMGRVQAATATSDAITQWHPRYLLLVGIAGGIAERKVNLGDILVSDQIVDYELQKITAEGPEIRWEVHRADPRLSGAASNLRGDGWIETIGVERPEAGRPACHAGPIASGDKVIAFGDALKKYRSVWPKLIGVEMEAAGAAAAAFQAAHPPGFFMVRSVSDLADKDKGTTGVEKWREYACNTAAAYAIAFLRSGPIPAREKILPRMEKQTAFPNKTLLKPGEFINREKELRTIFNRLRHGGSTAIIGGTKIGKTSLLLKLKDQATQNQYLDNDARNMMMIFVDLLTVGSDYTPTDFWSDLIRPFKDQISTAIGELYYDNAVRTEFKRDTLDQLFTQLGKSGNRLIILLDEFEILLSHPNFQDHSFFGLLRSLASRTNGLALTIASRWSVSKMIEWGQELGDTGSPWFNHLIQVDLGLMDEHGTELFLDRTSLGPNTVERRFFRRVIGRHPWFLRALIDFMIDLGRDELSMRAVDDLYKGVASHIDDDWRNMDGRRRTAIILLGLLDLGLRNEEYVPLARETESLGEFGRELRKLEKDGFVKRIAEGDEYYRGKHCVSWRSERWTMTSLVYVWWVNDVVVAGYRTTRAYDAWLADKGYLDIIPEKIWNDLVSQVRKIADWTAQSLADAIYAEEQAT